MKRSLHFLCIVTIVLIAIETNAQNKNNWYKNKFYVRGDIGASIPANKFRNRNAADPYVTKKLKQTAIYNIGIGYKITDNVRSDLNFSYRNFRYKAKDPKFPIAVSQKIKSYSVFFNGYFDFININKILKPYLTAGIGYGQNNSTDLIAQDTNSGTKIGYPGNKQKNFIWNIGFGTKFIINNTFNLDVSYKYVDLGKIQTKVNPLDTDVPSSQKIKSHEITGGVIINL